MSYEKKCENCMPLWRPHLLWVEGQHSKPFVVLNLVFHSWSLYSGWIMEMLYYVQTWKQRTLCAREGESMTQLTIKLSTLPWFDKSLLSAYRRHIFVKQTDVSTATMKTQSGRALAVLFGKALRPAPRYSMMLHKQNITHLTVREKPGPELSIMNTA